jgi:hypothetical protein
VARAGEARHRYGLLMSVVQLGPEAAGPNGDDVAAVFEAALDRTPRPRNSPP